MRDSPVDVRAKLSKGIDSYIVFNRYTSFLCLTYELVILSQIGNIGYLMFAAASPNVIGCGSTIFNKSLEQREACEQYETMKKSGNNSCEPILEYHFRSVGVEWGYFCSQTVEVKNSISFQMFGVMLGGIVFGQISDLFGRRKTMIICMVLTVLSGLLCAFARNLLMFAIIRTFVGFFVGGNLVVMYVYVIEKIPANARVKVNTFVTWSPNFVVLSCVAYLTGSWNRLTIAMNLLAAPSLLCFVFLYESPRWLAEKGRLNEAHQVVTAMNTWGVSADKKEKCFDDEEVMTAVGNAHKISCEMIRQKRYYFHHLFYSWSFLRYSMVLAFSCFTNAIAFYALLFNLEKISGSLYMNTAILGIFRYILNIMLAAVDHAFSSVGRKFVHTTALITVILSIALIVVLNKTNLAPEFKGLIRAFTVIGTGTISLVFIVNSITCAELFPTAIRNLAGANTATWNRVGSILAPQLFYLSEIEPSLPYIVIVVLFSIDALAFLILLPETKSRPLRDQMPPEEELILRSCKATRTVSIAVDDDNLFKSYIRK